MQKTVLVHDYFTILGGGERLSLSLSNAFGMDVVYGFKEDTLYPDKVFVTDHKALLPSAAYKLLLPAAYMAQQNRLLNTYDIRLFTGSYAPLAAPQQQKKGINIQYINTPPRHLYDQFDFYYQRAGVIKKLAMTITGPLYKTLYENAVARMDVLISNSHNIRKRTLQYLGVDSTVVYPPVDVEKYAWVAQGDYYLSTARLTPLKRVDMLIEAFKKMPDKKLIIASGGTEEDILKQRAANHDNIRFMGWVDDQTLQSLVGNALATLYIPKQEDFGISPVESMAAGKPVIGVAEGGMLETIVPQETGVLLRPDFNVSDIIAAVENLTPAKCLSMRSACEAQAQQFSRGAFIKAMSAFIRP